MRLPVAAVLVCLLVGGTAVARDHHSHHEHHGASNDPHKHLEKANALAGEGKCAEAVREYTAAYEKLQDPIVLFNRAECYRRIGESTKAAEDYRGFLKGFPAAPNRAEIEGRIAALEKAAAKPAAPVAARPPAPVAPVKAAPTPIVPAPPPAPPVARAPAPPPPAPAPAEVGPMPFLPPPPGSGGGKPLVEAPRETPSPSATEAAPSSSSRWWLWTTLAVVAVCGGFAAYWFTRPKDTAPPPTTYGNFRF